jgi:hypothetical protein
VSDRPASLAHPPSWSEPHHHRPALGAAPATAHARGPNGMGRGAGGASRATRETDLGDFEQRGQLSASLTTRIRLQ